MPDVRVLFGTWPGDMDDSFEETIDDLRHSHVGREAVDSQRPSKDSQPPSREEGPLFVSFVAPAAGIDAHRPSELPCIQNCPSEGGAMKKPLFVILLAMLCLLGCATGASSSSELFNDRDRLVPG